MNRLRRAFLAAAAVLGLVAAVLGGAFAAYPLQGVVVLRKLALRAGGASRVQAGPLAAWERDRCVPGAACRCVALVHGMGDSALTWDNVILGRDALPPPPGTRLLAVELPGTDGSPPPAEPSGYSIPAQAAALKEALASRCPRWTVAGNSLGGWIAAELALQWPEGVESLVLVNAAGLSDDTGLLLETGRVLADPTVEKLKDFIGRAYFKPKPVPPHAWQAIADSIKSRPTRETFDAFKLEYVLDRRAKDIKAPTIVLWGAADRVVPAGMGERWTRLIPGARLKSVPDCGHLPQQECPAAVSDALFPRS